MVIVAGQLTIMDGQREAFLDASKQAMAQARHTPGCRDFVVAADPLVQNRVNVYEEWETDEDLQRFRGTGPDDTLTELIVSASVNEHHIAGR